MTRNLLAITMTVQCVSGVVDHAVQRIRQELLPKYPNVDGVVRLQDAGHTGFGSMVSAIITTVEAHLDRLNTRRRETCPAADLVVGMQCGGSDAFSGVAANPALGHASDMLVRAGATVIYSENTEVRDAIDQPTARAAALTEWRSLRVA